jgi:hypothetical protein
MPEEIIIRINKNNKQGYEKKWYQKQEQADEKLLHKQPY